MSTPVHVVHAHVLGDRPALAGQLHAWRDRMGGALVVLGGHVELPGAACMPPGELRRWLGPLHEGPVIGWGEAALTVVSTLTCPTAAWLDGLPERGDRSRLFNCMGDRRMPVLVTSDALVRIINERTMGRARPCRVTPMLDHGQVAPEGRTLAIRGMPAESLTVRPVLDVPIRAGLVDEPWQCSAARLHPDWVACDAILRACGLRGLVPLDDSGTCWAGGAALPAPRRGEEPVLDLLDAWACGSRLLLPAGHGATGVPEALEDALVDCDVAPGLATEAALSTSSVGADRASVCAAWAAAAEASMDALCYAAQHS